MKPYLSLVISLVAGVLISMPWAHGSSIDVAVAGPEIFAGKWNGKGTYIFKGELTQCQEFKLVFGAQADSFKFVSGLRNCDKHQEQFYPVEMKFKGGKLYWNGRVVGSYDTNVLEARYRMPDGGTFRNWRMSMRREGKNLMYEESRTMEGETTPLISFSGLLIME
jgi:hypothetical protein